MTNTASRFGDKKLLVILQKLPTTTRYWVGFSGGADSTALLLALHQCRKHLATSVQAIHFHHGLNCEADSWMDHCREFCRTRSIPFSSHILNLQRSARASTEEDARNARYQAVVELLGRDEVYLTAHHADDQAETLFLNLMRGSGVEGLAGIPELRKLGAGWVARPLLNWRRSELEGYLRENSVLWLEDPSNLDQSFDRNYLRNYLFPLLEPRWPGLVNRLTRTARNARSTSEALADFIKINFAELIGDEHKMPLTALLRLELPLQALVLRQWLRLREIQALPESRMLEFLKQLSDARQGSRAEVRWKQWQLKLYQQFIWLQHQSIPENCISRNWLSGMKLELGAWHGHLQLHGERIDIPPGWRIGSRKAGARIRLRAKGPRHKLKELYRQSGMPPWMRAAIPVLYWDDEAVAVGDWFIAGKLKNWLRAHHLNYRWHPTDPLLSKLRSACHDFTVDP